jgi:lipase maturation factor 1
MRWILPRGVALCYAIAFWSWTVQCEGLVGSQGILPVQSLVDAVHAAEEREGRPFILEFPSVFRFASGDAMLTGVGWAGIMLALLAIIGVLQGPCLLLLWIGYRSVVSAGQIFWGYQWDALLLEAGFLMLFLVHWRSWLQWRVTPRAWPGAVFLVHWLLFRLMLLSGAVKLWGGDEVWENGTALFYHFETQPLPTALGWWAHHLPRDVLVWGCWGMYAVELGGSLLMWCGRWGRLIAGCGFIALMVGVALTGNYTFFNLLTAVLAVSLMQDRWWPRAIVERVAREPVAVNRFGRWFMPMAAALVVGCSLVSADSFLQGRLRSYVGRLPASWADRCREWVDPWQVVNSYGLFQDMTEQRLEVTVEISEDGGTFFPLHFKWKADDEQQPPGLVAPHQPRLDWQMWFAALYPGFVPQRDAGGGPMQWFGAFLQSLTERREPVWALVDEENSLVKRDRILAARATLWRYRFSTPEERRETGAWWVREYRGVFSPTFYREG